MLNDLQLPLFSFDFLLFYNWLVLLSFLSHVSLLPYVSAKCRVHGVFVMDEGPGIIIC